MPRSPPQRVQRHRHDAGPDRAPEHDGEIDCVEHEHDDPMLALDAEPGERRPDPARKVLEFAIGQRAARVLEGGLAAPALRHVAVDELDGGVVAARLGHASSRAAYRDRFSPGCPDRRQYISALPSDNRDPRGIRALACI
jgi:hypothetical protein